MSKAAEAFRTISEVAADLDVPKHVLRFWEAKFPQIRPMKRGGGRRYYRPEDLELLRGIRRLLHAEGYTIKGVQKILREQGIDQVKAFAHVTASAEKPKNRGRAKSDGAAGDAVAGPIAATPATAAVTRKGARGPASRDVDSIIRGAIVELETCRRLLLGEPVQDVASSSPPVRVRAARG
jgi:DNA-binding transcriptional MerR regulator